MQMEIQEEEEGRGGPVVSSLCLLSDLCARWGVGTLMVILQSQVDGRFSGVLVKNARMAWHVPTPLPTQRRCSEYKGYRLSQLTALSHTTISSRKLGIPSALP